MGKLNLIQSILLAAAITAAVHLLNSVNAGGLSQLGIALVLIMIIVVSFVAGMFQTAQSRQAMEDRRVSEPRESRADRRKRLDSLNLNN